MGETDTATSDTVHGDHLALRHFVTSFLYNANYVVVIKIIIMCDYERQLSRCIGPTNDSFRLTGNMNVCMGAFGHNTTLQLAFQLTRRNARRRAIALLNSVTTALSLEGGRLVMYNDIETNHTFYSCCLFCSYDYALDPVVYCLVGLSSVWS